VPKGVPEEKGIKRLAVQVEDHPVDYIDFTGKIPEGQYGAGEVKIFDHGNFNLISRSENEIEFELKGKKLSGSYVLIRTKLGGKDKNWLIFKK
jgi:DNA ligase D-like protein (predicted 3'-phosphoesterase)